MTYSAATAVLLLLAGGHRTAHANGKGQGSDNGKGQGKGNGKLPNIVVMMVDDLGWNQVGYHANPRGNDEIWTPSIDKYSNEGIRINQGHATPWCGPSRAAFQTGTLAAFDEGGTGASWSFGPDTGFVSGLPPEIQTLPRALKEFGNYATSYAGKWGLQGTMWTNTPMGAGYDVARAFPSHSMDGCDGMLTIGNRGPAGDGSGALTRSLPGLWDQGPDIESDLCKYFESIHAEGKITEREKDIACRSQPRVVPKLVDQDFLDFTKDRIRGHDYEEQPLYHMLSLQLMHGNVAYPRKYDESHPHPDVDLPDHFKEGKVKPTASNDDMRLTLANAMRYVDDVFDDVVQSIKDAGQWDNTIIFFTSDNGGSIFPLNFNNNYPLRGGKRSIFQGGYRLVQFLAGGWFQPASAKNDPVLGRVSDTFMFIQDWAPTFLEMAGGKDAVDALYQKTYTPNGEPDPFDPMEGNPMWEYIQSSVQVPAQAAGPMQLPRLISYNKDLYFNVTMDETIKVAITPPELSVFYIRKWSPKWPEGKQVTPDFGYVSVQPCRPDGAANPSSCCVFNVAEDEEEDHPLGSSDGWDAERCADATAFAESLYLGQDEEPFTSIGKSCETQPDQKARYPTLGCQEVTPANQGRLKVSDAALGKQILTGFKIYDLYSQGNYSLWTHYGAVGGAWISYDPETREQAHQVDYLDEDGEVWSKCVCETIDPDIRPGDVDAYLPTFFSPSVCISTEKTTFEYDHRLAVPCRGFVRDPAATSIEEYINQGVDADSFVKFANFERKGFMGGISVIPSKTFYKVISSYITRENFVEWPALGKWPYITAKQNTCPAKNVVQTPIPYQNAAPWFLASGDGGERFFGVNMCQDWTTETSWCPSAIDPAHGNPLQKPIEAYDPEGDWVEVIEDDGTKRNITPIVGSNRNPDGSKKNLTDTDRGACSTTCAKSACTTAYIGTDPTKDWGMALPTIVNILKENDNLSTLVTAIEAVPGLVNALASISDITLFAPTNDAFNALPPGTLQNLLANTNDLQQVLLYHAVDGKYDSSSLSPGDYTTLEGSSVTVTLDGSDVKVDEATVVTPDIAACANIIHAIDEVLDPTAPGGLEANVVTNDFVTKQAETETSGVKAFAKTSKLVALLALVLVFW